MWGARPVLGWAFGGKRIGGFGIYAKVLELRTHLEKWAGKTFLPFQSMLPALFLMTTLAYMLGSLSCVSILTRGLV